MAYSVLDKKVCIVSISLGKGGAERSTALLSQMLNSLGYQVHLVILTDDISYGYEGTLFNLGLKKRETNTFFSRLLRFRRFKKYIVQHKFDYIIDNRVKNNSLKELFYLNYIYQNQKLIYVVRSAYLENYFPGRNTYLAKYTSKRIIERVHKIVAVSKFIQKKVEKKFNSSKVYTIYNPIEELSVNSEKFKEKYILFLGRLVDEVKNISLLIEAYAKSNLPKYNIHLKILGVGPDILFLKKKVKNINLLQYVSFIPYTPEVGNFLSQAKFTVLTSRYEGFPRVLIESLSVGTPVVSVNCESGPSEIINHEKNGLLVENHNPSELALAFNRMYEDEELYTKCKKNACSSVEHLSMRFIAKQWKEVLSL